MELHVLAHQASKFAFPMLLVHATFALALAQGGLLHDSGWKLFLPFPKTRRNASWWWRRSVRHLDATTWLAMAAHVILPTWTVRWVLLVATWIHVACDVEPRRPRGLGKRVEDAPVLSTTPIAHDLQHPRTSAPHVPIATSKATSMNRSVEQDNERDGPVFVVELCRHGDRTPIAVFPKDPWPIPTWKWGPGQLTPIGEAAQYNLGELMKNKYQPPWPANYTLHAVRARSTDVDRCLMSAESQLAGIFPPGSGTPHALPHEWQAVPIHTAPIGYDALLRAFDHAHCPRYDQIMSRRKEGKAYQAMEKEHAAFLHQVGTLAGMKISLSNLYIVSDAMVCEQAHGRPWATGMTDDIFKKAVNLSDWTLAQMFAPGPEERRPHELARLTAGNLVQQIKELMQLAAEKNETVPLFQLFSAHDTTVAALLTALDAYDGISPPYNSTVIFELWETGATADSADGTFHVKAYYNWKKITLPGCPSDSPCSLEDFVRGVEPIAVQSEVDWAAECQVLDAPHHEGVSYLVTTLVGLITFGIGVASTLFFPKLFSAWKNRTEYMKMDEVAEIDLQATDGTTIGAV